MEPVAVWVRKGGEWAIIDRCRLCGKLASNRIAADDNPMLLMSIAMRPLCTPPFPLGAHRGDDGTDGRGGGYSAMRGVGDADPCIAPRTHFSVYNSSPMCYTE